MEEEYDSPYVSFLPPFSLRNEVVSCDDVEIGKPENQIVDPLFPPSSSFHDQARIHKNFKCCNNTMEPNVNIDPLIPRDDINVYSLNPESDLIKSITSSRDSFHHLSFTPRDSMDLELLYQSIMLAIALNPLYFQYVGSISD